MNSWTGAALGAGVAGLVVWLLKADSASSAESTRVSPPVDRFDRDEWEDPVPSPVPAPVFVPAPVPTLPGPAPVLLPAPPLARSPVIVPVEDGGGDSWEIAEAADGFWDWAKANIVEVPFVPEVGVLYYVMMDPRTPISDRLSLAATVAYIISPVDLLPEAVYGPAGYADDLAALLAAIELIAPNVRREHFRSFYQAMGLPVPSDEELDRRVRSMTGEDADTWARSASRRIGEEVGEEWGDDEELELDEQEAGGSGPSLASSPTEPVTSHVPRGPGKRIDPDNFLSDPRVKVIDWVRTIPKTPRPGVTWRVRSIGPAYLLVAVDGSSFDLPGVKFWRKLEVGVAPNGAWNGYLLITKWQENPQGTSEPEILLRIANFQVVENPSAVPVETGADILDRWLF